MDLSREEVKEYAKYQQGHPDRQRHPRRRTRAAELHHTQTGKSVSSIRLATNRTIKGEKETQFHTIVCWDRLAETTAEYVKKGDPLYV